MKVGRWDYMKKFAAALTFVCALLATAEELAPFPAWSEPYAVTRGPHEHLLASYFGIDSWSPNRRYISVLETDVNGRLPEAGERCAIGLVDLQDGNRWIPVATTACWNFQEAAMAHWIDDDTLLFNDLRDGRFVTVILNWRTRAERIVPHPVSAVSADRTWAVSINYARLYLVRPDYGYAGDGQDARADVTWPEDDGIWIVDLKTGEAKLALSIAQGRGQMPGLKPIDEKSVPKDPTVTRRGLAYYCHTAISKDDRKIFFLARSVDWYDKTTHKASRWQTTSFTVNADGTGLRRCFKDGWAGSHFNWAPDGSHRMLVTVLWDGHRSPHGGDAWRGLWGPVEFTVGEEDKVRHIGAGVLDWDWHCIYSPDGKFMSGDTYPNRNFERPWVLVRLADGMTMPMGSFYVPEAYRPTYWRCDLHARYRPDGRQIGFNSVHEGSRQVYLRDISPAEMPAPAPAQARRAPHGRMDRTRFNIGTYRFGDWIRDEEHVRELKEAGIDYVCSMRPGRDAERFYRTMDLFAKYGVGCITEGGTEIGAACPIGAGRRGKMREKNPPAIYEKAAERFRDHPALWGLDVCDEPSAVDMPYLGEVCTQVRRLFPNQFPYVNLFPSYARVATNTADVVASQMGATSYAEYIGTYCRTSPLDYISFDCYPYSKTRPNGVPIFFENLRIVSDACRRTGRSLWFVGQVNTWWGRPPLAENCLRYQAHTAMAYGAEAVVWACWTKGWWTNNVINAAGKKTVAYDRIKRVNAELHRLGDEFMRYRRVATHLVGYDRHPHYLAHSGCVSEPAASTGWFRDVRAVDGGPLLVGEMVPKTAASRGSAIFVFASDDPYDEKPQQRTVRFVPHGRTVKAFGGHGPLEVLRGENNVCTIPIMSNAAVMVISED